MVPKLPYASTFGGVRLVLAFIAPVWNLAGLRRVFPGYLLVAAVEISPASFLTSALRTNQASVSV